MWQELENLKKQLDEAFLYEDLNEASRLACLINKKLSDMQYAEYEKVA